MKIVDFKKLYDMEYTLDIARVKCFWNYIDTRNRTKGPRLDNGIMYFLDISGNFYQANGDVIPIERGDIIYLPCDIRYDSHFVPHKANYKNGVNSYLIDFHLFDTSGEKFTLSDRIIKLPVENRKYHKTIDKINTLYFFSNKPTMKIKGLMYTILSDISEELRNTGKNPETIDDIYNALLFIEENYTQNVSIPEIAQIYNLSESTFRRYFKRITGLSPANYIKKIRMERAESLLSNHIYNVKDVAELVGIPDPAYFSKTYKDYFGISPIDTISNSK